MSSQLGLGAMEEAFQVLVISIVHLWGGAKGGVRGGVREGVWGREGGGC